MLLPVFDNFSLRAIKLNIRPPTIGIGEYWPISSAMIWLEKVVPMLAPITIPNDCLKVSVPVFTRIIVIMMTAEEESSITVIMVPVMIAVKRLAVSLLIHCFDFSPSTSFKVSERLEMAKRNKPNPPKTDKIISISKC